MKLAIKIDTKDNVAMTTETLTKGETVSVLSDEAMEIDKVAVIADVPLPFHKIALGEIRIGEPVLKYGEIIGYATAPIERGEWVHVHNVESANLGSRASARSEAHG